MLKTPLEQLKELRTKQKELLEQIEDMRKLTKEYLLTQTPIKIGSIVKTKINKVGVISNLYLDSYNDKLCFEATTLKKDGTCGKNSAGLWCNFNELTLIGHIEDK